MEFAISTFIQWFNADEVRPAKDGNFLCLTKAGSFLDLNYCVEAHAFNANFVGDEKAITVRWWAETPEMPVKNDEG